ncbi:hypothetical protein GCM10022198_14340 [Klugiella xanthotipulae]|uniref:serine/threonine-protein kinase n=1 Tax=Klugiella xanthotipulae TaxID=244735 RepID=UPI001FE28275|nr:serine/threonine-protein kinase [Klugiella xanthotipulae]
MSGYHHIRILGKGGFAYVFLYEQDFPRAEVAVKVLTPKVANKKLREMFLSEANLMSQLKAHPSVLTVHNASIAPDGRPYLVMEYCPSSLGAGYKEKPLSVSEVLRVGIKIGSALETAHRVGFLHRDIKPSNILLTQYGHPVLSDFGIAATAAALASEHVEGMSVPWSAPEVLRGETAGTVTSEVYSLAATLFTLLLGRSPYELPGDEKQRNKREVVRSRIVGRDRLQSLGRPDVPPQFEALLAQSMSKNPTARPQSMLEFVRGLQIVETQLGFAQTPAEIADDARIQASRTLIDSDGMADGPAQRVPLAGTHRRYRHSGNREPHESAEETGVTVIRSASGSGDNRSRRRRRRILWGSLGSVAVLAAAAVVSVLLWGGSTGIPIVSNITAEPTDDAVVFTWNDPGLGDGDRYLVSTSDGEVSTQRDTEYRAAPSTPGAPVCITVTVTREGKPGEVSSETCSSVGG